MYGPEVLDKLTPSEIKQIQKKKVGKSKSKCTVCLDHFKKGQIMQILPCNHKFHRKCVKTWFVDSTCCPNCRFDIKKHFKEQKSSEQEVQNFEIPKCQKQTSEPLTILKDPYLEGKSALKAENRSPKRFSKVRSEICLNNNRSNILSTPENNIIEENRSVFVSKLTNRQESSARDQKMKPIRRMFGSDSHQNAKRNSIEAAETSSNFGLNYRSKNDYLCVKVDNRPTARSSRQFEPIFDEDEEKEGTSLSILNKCFYIPSLPVSRKSHGSSNNR